MFDMEHVRQRVRKCPSRVNLDYREFEKEKEEDEKAGEIKVKSAASLRAALFSINASFLGLDVSK